MPSSPERYSRARRHDGATGAFTLIEVLVVISIIALIIGILVPALGAARRESKATPCAANLRSIAQAVAVYLNESRTYPPSYVYGDSISGATWRTDEQGPTSPNPINGYIHWSFSLLGDGEKVPENAFRCPAAPKGGAPATNPGSNPDDWDAEALQRNELGQGIGSSPPKDRQARRMAYTANGAIVPRNKFIGGSARKNQLVGEGRVQLPSQTILATEFVHMGNWRTVFKYTVSKSHRPISPFLGLTQGEDVFAEPDVDGGPAYRYPTADTIVPMSRIGPDELGYGRNPLNAVGRSHPGKDKWIGGTANFSFIDGHVERMTAVDTINRRLWGDRYYSLTGNNTKVQ